MSSFYICSWCEEETEIIEVREPYRSPCCGVLEQ